MALLKVFSDRSRHDLDGPRRRQRQAPGVLDEIERKNHELEETAAPARGQEPPPRAAVRDRHAHADREPPALRRGAAPGVAPSRRATRRRCRSSSATSTTSSCFNDTYGHQKGDDCLVRVAQAMEEALNRPADLVARYGGEEFVALLVDTDVDGARLVAERMRDARRGRSGIEHRASTAAAVPDGQPRRRHAPARGRPVARGPRRPRRPGALRGEAGRAQPGRGRALSLSSSRSTLPFRSRATARARPRPSAVVLDEVPDLGRSLPLGQGAAQRKISTRPFARSRATSASIVACRRPLRTAATTASLADSNDAGPLVPATAKAWGFFA